MKIPLLSVGVVLIVIGAILLAYEGFNYNKHEVVAEVGSLKLTADTQEHVYISPIFGAISLIAGVGLVIISRRGGGGL